MGGFASQTKNDVELMSNVKRDGERIKQAKPNIELRGVHKRASEVDVSRYDFPFENLVFEGGGSKAMAYCGALRLFEELGMTVASGKIKRVCGTSAGGMVGLMVALGYTSYEIEHFMEQDIKHIIVDHRFGYLSLLPNIFKDYGWNPGKRLYDWFGERIEEKLGSPDVTFMEMYNLLGVEYCVVVVNLNQMSVEYCHPKTTPDMPLRLALKISTTIPVMYAPTRFAQYGYDDLFVDGGLICVYPIHVFDGWWLSMKNEDGFFLKLRSITEISESMEKGVRFGAYNDKTVGFVIYSDDEEDLFRSHLQNRVGTELSLDDLPNTKLAKRFKAKAELKEESVQEYQEIMTATDHLFTALTKHDLNGDQRITLDEFVNVMDDTEVMTEADRRILFDQDICIKEIFDEMSQYDGSIEFHDLNHYLERRGLKLQSKVMGHRRREINSLSSYLASLYSSLAANVSKQFMEKRDVLRTVGINTGHIQTLDLEMDPEDRVYVIERGRKSALSFLKYYVIEKQLSPTVSMEIRADGASGESDGDNTEEITGQTDVNVDM